MIKEIKSCRLCGGPYFEDIINLGNQYVVDFVETEDNLLSAPLRLVRCVDCSLVQLKHSVSANRLFNKFWYKSGISETMRKALHDIVVNASNMVDLDNGDRVLDIGSNDGTLLAMYPHTIFKVGVEPCHELAKESIEKKRALAVFPKFFTKDILLGLDKFKIITAIAMFYDVEDPVKFLRDCRRALADDGVIVIQMNYLYTMLDNTTIDNISHEHLTYWTLTTLKKAAAEAVLEIQSVEVNDVNGGSFRVYLKRKGAKLKGLQGNASHQKEMEVIKMLKRESEISNWIYNIFRSEVERKVKALRQYTYNLVSKGYKVYIYGASTRGTALLQVLNMPKGTFIGAAERDMSKFGLHMVSGMIPIYDEDSCRNNATHFLVLPYHFKDQILSREKEWLEKGGEFIFPLPEPFTINKNAKYPLSDFNRFIAKGGAE